MDTNHTASKNSHDHSENKADPHPDIFAENAESKNGNDKEGHSADIVDENHERKKRTALAGRSGSKRTEYARYNSNTFIKLNCADTGACAESFVVTPLYSIDESHESKTAHCIE